MDNWIMVVIMLGEGKDSMDEVVLDGVVVG